MSRDEILYPNMQLHQNVKAYEECQHFKPGFGWLYNFRCEVAQQGFEIIMYESEQTVREGRNKVQSPYPIV